jgi:hypothetical protein
MHKRWETASGVDIILDITAGVPHVFQSFAGCPPDEADQALDRGALFISQHIPPARRPRRPGPTDRRFRGPSPNQPQPHDQLRTPSVIDHGALDHVPQPGRGGTGSGAPR